MKLRIRYPKSRQAPIRLHIQHLVLEGLPLAAGAGGRVQEAVAAALARRLEATGLAPEFRAGGAVPSAPGGELRLAAGLTPADLGARIAHAIHTGIARGAARQTGGRNQP
jgi:hypothetical protein